jgi:hypothetical protein
LRFCGLAHNCARVRTDNGVANGGDAMESVLTKPLGTFKARELLFWEQAEALAGQFAAGLGQPLSDEAQCGIQRFCEWPMFSGSEAEDWNDWDGRFDSAMLARIDGRDVVFIGIGSWVDEGLELDAIIDAVRDFVRWAGALGVFDGEQAERVCAEIELARETWAQSIAENENDPWLEVAGPDGCPCCAADEAVAPFMGWLLDTTTFTLERRLLGQRLAICALEQLGLTQLAEGAFYRLDIAACLARIDERSVREPDRSELAAVARAFATYLAHRCGLSGAHKRRMQSEADRWAATPVQAAS